MRKLKEQVDSTPMPEFAQNLIQEKNDEIDHLNAQLATLRARDTMGDNKTTEIERLVSVDIIGFYALSGFLLKLQM